MRALVQFAQCHPPFRVPELESIAKALGVALAIVDSTSSLDSPFCLVDFPSEIDARRVVQRSVSTKALWHLWASGTTYDDVIRSVQPRIELYRPYRHSTFRFQISSFGVTLTQEERMKAMERFVFMGLEGRANLSKEGADVTFGIIEDHSNTKTLRQVYFGRLISYGNRSLVHTLSLKTRPFVGTTSMDPEMTLYMANMALVQKGSLVMDPFAGTGSIMLGAARVGAYVFGADIDYRNFLRPSRRNRAWFQDNWKAYGLEDQFLGTVIADINSPMVRGPLELFDAIITDPPYGVRATTKRQEFEDGEPDSWTLPQILNGLFDFSARTLAMGGRLVYWLPTISGEYVEADLPIHPCFKLLYNSEQPFNTWARRLITMEKIKPYQPFMATSQQASFARFREKYFEPKTPKPLLEPEDLAA